MNNVQLEYESKNDLLQMYLDDLKNVIIKSNASLEGNCFYHNGTLNLYNELYTKQLNLFWCGKQENENICEIGFNAGHSSMLLLLGKSDKLSKFTIFDIGHHAYTRPCFEYIKTKFSDVNFEYIEGDSTITIPEWIQMNKELMYKYDLVHVDGGHTEHCIFNDMKHADLLLKKNGIMIVDDTNYGVINSYVDLYLSSGNYIEVNVIPTKAHPHRVLQKIK
jgi:hypothetical protein